MVVMIPTSQNLPWMALIQELEEEKWRGDEDDDGDVELERGR